MHSLEPEVEQLHAAGVLDAEAASRLQALESGAVFSLFYELRIISYVAVLLIVTGVGLLLKQHYERIGPMAIALLIALLAAACYVLALRWQRHQQQRSVVGDYVLLLGGLLVSADVAFMEVQFQWLGDHWAWYLLLLMAFHAACAYRFDSRLLLSLALTTLLGWFGASHHFGDLFWFGSGGWEYGLRSLLAGAVVLVWRVVNPRIPARSDNPVPFNEVLEHYAINPGFWAGLLWCSHDSTALLGATLVAVLSAWVIRLGMLRRSEWFAVYGVVYGAIGMCMVTVRYVRPAELTILVLLSVTLGGAMVLWQLHQKFRESAS